jgi:glyoxylase-like metal-dependent hydrolase (beta-lactamase superfamily II)
MSHQTIDLGAVQISRVHESWYTGLNPDHFFLDWNKDVLNGQDPALFPQHYDLQRGELRLSIHSWLLKYRGRHILIDCSCGNCKTRPMRPMWHQKRFNFLENLAAAGSSPDQISLVINTHLHADHVGWNTYLDKGEWQPTFAKARYLMSRKDYEHFSRVEQDPALPPAAFGSFVDSVAPVVEKGLVDFLDPPTQIESWLKVVSTPGHSPGHMSVIVESEGKKAIFCGDVLHHAFQVARPELNSSAFTNLDDAIRSRRQVLEWCADEGMLLLTGHFTEPFFFRVKRDGQVFKLEPAIQMERA